MKILPAFVDKVVHDYTNQLKKIELKNIVGVYLTGSVPMGDYHTNKSDIDFITITEEDLGQEQLNRMFELMEGALSVLRCL